MGIRVNVFGLKRRITEKTQEKLGRISSEYIYSVKKLHPTAQELNTDLEPSYFRPFFTLRTRFLVLESIICCACFLISSRVSIWTSSSPDDSSSDRSPGARVACAAWLETCFKRVLTSYNYTGDFIVENGVTSSTRDIAQAVRSSPARCRAPSKPWTFVLTICGFLLYT